MIFQLLSLLKMKFFLSKCIYKNIVCYNLHNYFIKMYLIFTDPRISEIYYCLYLNKIISLEKFKNNW